MGEYLLLHVGLDDVGHVGDIDLFFLGVHFYIIYNLYSQLYFWVVT